MRIYISGKWEERELVKQIYRRLEKAGHTITCDWTNHTEEDDGYPTQYAEDDIEGVRTADLFIGLFLTDHSYKGALVELGVALGRPVPVYIIGHAIDSCLFADALGVTKFETIDDCLEALKCSTP